MDRFPERLKEAMKLRNMKQTNLADMTGINKGTISRYTHGIHGPGREHLKLISEALNVSEAYLLGYSSSPERLEDPELQGFIDELDDSIHSIKEENTRGSLIRDSLRMHGISEEDADAILTYLTLTEEQKDLMRRWFRMLAEAD